MFAGELFFSINNKELCNLLVPCFRNFNVIMPAQSIGLQPLETGAWFRVGD